MNSTRAEPVNKKLEIYTMYKAEKFVLAYLGNK